MLIITIFSFSFLNFYSVATSIGTAAVLSKDFCGFPMSIKANAEIVH
jgi:hypothetical protein